ncbi:hypothetical protein C923_00580 [Plasmodium falciparum UGT5.1]|uniref:Uncharacterized protein n=1 Tax=Plasmodium falciparum UGT5.1 TaxID=1237627 RepID=W7K4A4_PLAFA|nr:hypothetical protein C923_00580 [Plasmodium falciparum UGT5.1]
MCFNFYLKKLYAHIFLSYLYDVWNKFIKIFLNSRQYDMTKKYKEGVDFLKESERRAQDIEDIGYTIMSELNSQRSAILRTKHHKNIERMKLDRNKIV